MKYKEDHFLHNCLLILTWSNTPSMVMTFFPSLIQFPLRLLEAAVPLAVFR